MTVIDNRVQGSVLNWEQRGGGSWWAYSGRISIGLVVQRDDGTVAWEITAVSMRHIGQSSGETRSPGTAKRSLARSWHKWLSAAGLEPLKVEADDDED